MKITLKNQKVYGIPCLNAERKREHTTALAQNVGATSDIIDYDSTIVITNVEHWTRRIAREDQKIKSNNLKTKDEKHHLDGNQFTTRSKTKY